MTHRPARIEGLARAITLLVCGALLVATVLSYGWVQTGMFGDQSAGPRGVQGCTETGECLAFGWGQVAELADEGVPRDVRLFSTLTLVAGLAAAAAAALCAALVLGRRRLGGLGLLASGVIGAATGVALYFEIRLFQTSAIGIGLTFGWAGVVAVPAAITAGILVHSLSKLGRATAAVASSSSPSSWSPSSSV
jgi:hypothetical protein